MAVEQLSAPAASAATYRAAADSVFAYVRRTAEHVDDGVRWQTLTYEGQPHYTNRLHNGTAGIAVFLADYFAVTLDRDALELAEQALRWSSAPAQLADAEAHPFRGPGMRDSLPVGRAGVGMAWLHLARVTGEPEHLARARDAADVILADEPGTFLYLLSGAAGEGLLFLELWATTRDERCLARAVRYGEILERHVIRDESGAIWPARDPSAVPPPGMKFAGGAVPVRLLGYGIGLAGVTHFLAALYVATRDARWGALAREGANTLARHAVADHGGINWNGASLLPGDPIKLVCQWCRGAAGIGLALTRCAAALGEPSYLALAESAGECVYASGDVRQNPSLCHGLCGNALLFLALHQQTGKALWRERADDFAQRALAYRQAPPEGDVWQADEPGTTSPELMCGAAGVGYFYLRLIAPDRPALPFL